MIRAAVFFGGRSVEHEISVITALEVLNVLDVTAIAAFPVYVAQDGRWFVGEALWSKDFYRGLPRSLGDVTEVTLLPHPRSPSALTVTAGARKGEVIQFDVALPIFHGQFGEDGCMQGLFELADVPYTGCGVLASAVSMNKATCKAVAKAHGIPVLPWFVVEKCAAQANYAEVVQRLMAEPGLQSFPLFVKPNNLGSSIGVGRGVDAVSLASSLANVFKYDEQAIVEPCVTSMFEINVSVLEGVPPLASVVEVPVSESGTLTYEEKYMRGGGKKGPTRAQSQGMASLVRAIDPESLSSDYKERVRTYALKAYESLGCRGVVRFDFMVNKENGELFFNELNALPGSLAHYLWAKSNPPRLYPENLTRMIKGALDRHARKATLERNTGFRALK